MSDKYFFKREGRDPFIDFIKGISILFVIFTHNFQDTKYLLFCLWGAQSVPVFLLIQSYHSFNSFNKGNLTLRKYFSPENLHKLYKRIIIPFAILLLLQIIILVFLSQMGQSTAFLKTLNLRTITRTIISSGGYGPGAYYIWIYLQFFILIPALFPLFKRFSNGWLLLIFIIISECFEIFCSVISMPPLIYRLSFFRYFFIIYLGYIVSKQTLKMNKWTILLPIISILFIISDNYFNINMEPFIYQTAWKGFHWIAYFYTLYFFLNLLKVIYNHLLDGIILDIIKKMGHYSYEIFLCQMFVFGFIGLNSFDFINNTYLKVISFICITTLISIAPVFIYKKYSNSKFTVKNV